MSLPLRGVVLLLVMLLSGGSLLAVDDVPSWLGKGNAFDEHGESDRALACYLEAEKIQPQNVEVLCRIAKQYQDLTADAAGKEAKRGLYRSALAYSERAATLDPKNSMAHTLVAIGYGRLTRMISDNRTRVGYSRKIESHARKALALKPDNDLALYVLGVWQLEMANLSSLQRTMVKWIYGSIPPASNEEAERLISKAISLNPSRPAYFVELGRVYAAMGRNDEARTALLKALAMPNTEKSDPLMKERAERALKKLK